MDGISTIVIQCSTIDLPPIVTYIDTNKDVELTWSELCRRTIEDDYLHSSTYLLTLLRNIHPYSSSSSSSSTTTDATTRQRHRQLAAYRLRYDLGMGTIIKPTWSESSSPTSSSRAGVRGVQKMDEDEEEEEAYYYIDVNVYLQSANNGLKFEPYESILSSLSEGGGREDTTTTTTTTTKTTTKTTFVNLHISPVRYEEDSDDDDEVHRRRPFPITSKLTRMLICKEHDHCSNYIATGYYFIIDDKNVGSTMDDNNDNCHHDAVVHFIRNARCVNSHKDGKEVEEEDEVDNNASAMIETYNDVMESTNKETDEGPAQHYSAINSGQVDDAHENIDEACNNDRNGDGEFSSDEDTSSSSSSSSSSSDDDDDDASRENNRQRLHDIDDTRKNCKADSVGESLLNKHLASKLTSPSKNALKRMRRTNNDPAVNKTDEEAMHHVNDSVSGGVGSGEGSGGIIEAQETGTPSLSSKEKSIFTLDTPFSAGASAGRKRRRQQERDEEGPTDNCKSATTAVINENCNVTKTKNGDDPSSQKSLTKVTTSAAAGKAESSLEYLKKKQAELRRTESSIVTINDVLNCKDAFVTQVAGTTSKTICANSNVSTAEEDGGTTKIIKVGTSKKRILTKKRQEDQEEGKKKNERSPAGSITSFNSSEFIIPTAESDKHIPYKVAVGFPPGWTMRLISRIVNNKKRGSNWYYSPKLKHPFLTKGKANEFVKLLEQTNGDEKEAMILFTKKGKGKNAVHISESVSSLPLVDELDLDGNNNTAKAIAATTKRPKRTNDTTKALHELASKQVVETLTADVEQSQSKKRKAKLTTGRNNKEKNTKR